MKITFYIFMLISVFAHALFGNELSTDSVNLEEKMKLIQVSEPKNLNFKQIRTLSSLKRKLVSNGRITITPSGLTMETISPRYSWVRFDSLGIYTKRDSLASEQKSERNNSIGSTMNSLYSLIFTGDIALISTALTVQYDESDTVWNITLSPKERELSRMIESIILSGETELESINTVSTSGDFTKLLFSEVPFE